MKPTIRTQPRARGPSFGFLALLASTLLGASLAHGQVVGTQPRMGVMLWGDDTHGQCQAPALPGDVKNVQIACGTSHTLAIQSNGQLSAWGDGRFGQTYTPPYHHSYSYLRIAASDHNLALRNDGQLLAWGRNDFGQCNVPPLPVGSSWTAFAAGALHSVALRSDGMVLCWGDNSYKQCTVPKLMRNTRYVAIAAGARHTVALRSDGLIFAWGDKSLGQTNPPPFQPPDPILAIAAGGAHSLALTLKGEIFAWGSNDSGQLDVPARPYGHSFVAISAGGRHSMALLDDGSVFVWGSDGLGQCRPPKVLRDFEAVRISAGGQHSAALFQAPASDIVPVCTGNGAATPCPCGNDVAPDQKTGCANSTGLGAELSASGHSRLGADDLVLYGTGLPRTLAMVLQGGTPPSGSVGGAPGLPVGDGLFCLQTPMVRLAVVQTTLQGFSFPAPGGDSISKLGGIARPRTAYYQVWYRDPLPVCKSQGENGTNALRVVWTY